MRKTLAITALAAILPLAACNESENDATSSSTNTQPTSNASPEWLLASMPADPVTVVNARETAKEGDTITITGLIGGRMDALSNEASVFVLVDESLHNPCVGEDDHCATPWDYCCTSREVIASNLATVRLVGPDGRTLSQDLRRFGIEELDKVVIVGSVDPRPTPEVLNIKAEKIYVASN